MPILLFLFLLSFSACQSSQPWVVVDPDWDRTQVEWSAEDLKKDYTIYHLERYEQESHHVVRLLTVEIPHIHARHDLTVFVLKGQARVHFEDRTRDVKAGDIIQIPRGTIHWAENTGDDASEVYAIFSPPFDGKDFIPV